MAWCLAEEGRGGLCLHRAGVNVVEAAAGPLGRDAGPAGLGTRCRSGLWLLPLPRLCVQPAVLTGATFWRGRRSRFQG